MSYSSFVLVLCCATLVNGADVTGFNCTLGKHNEDTVDVEAVWNAGTCFAGLGPDYTLYFSAPNGTETRVGGTTDIKLTLPKMELWTNFTIKLRKTCWFIAHTDYSTTVFTGPGSPHKVSNVKIDSGAQSVKVTIEEAQKMPRIPDEYEMKYCVNDTQDCNIKVLLRNSKSELSIKLKDVITGLKPLTTYQLNTTAIITDGDETYRSDALTVFMLTTHAEKGKSDPKTGGIGTVGIVLIILAVVVVVVVVVGSVLYFKKMRAR